MQKLRYFLSAFLTMGRSPQSFIGAPCIPLLLKAFPRSKQKWLALRILALSPHYFYRHANQSYSQLSQSQFLEAEYGRNEQSRRMIYELILKQFLAQSYCVLDYGCGPGFLARIAAKSVLKLYAVDISSGVLECAKVINSATNVEYKLVSQAQSIPDSSLDLIYSFAVVQHMTNEALEQALALCSKKSKPGAKIVFQVQLADSKWKTETEWRANSSIPGQIKFRYALHCFARNPDYLFETLPKFGFRVRSLTPIQEVCTTIFDDICFQHLLIGETIKPIRFS